MAKRKALIESDSSSDCSDVDSQFLNLAKKKKKAESTSSDSDNGGGRRNMQRRPSRKSVSSDSDRSLSPPRKVEDKGKLERVHRKKSTESTGSGGRDAEIKDKGRTSEPEEGEVSSDDENDTKKVEKQTSYASDGGSGFDTDNSEFNDGYDENLMGDKEDRSRLAGLSEKEREQEIFKRIERRELMKTRWEIERKLRLARRKKGSPARQAEVARPPAAASPNSLPDSIHSGEESESKERPKERKRTVDDKRVSAMAALKARREDRQRREQDKEAEKQRDEDDPEEGTTKKKGKLKASDIYSDDSASDSEDEKSRGRRRSSSRSDSDSDSDGKSVASRRGRDKQSSVSEKEERRPSRPLYISTREDLSKIRLSRFKMERFVHLPFFERVARGCFVRIAIGNNSERPMYRTAEIMEVCETAKVYQLGSTRTNKGLKLRHGGQERIFRLEFISNRDFSDTEFTEWKEAIEKASHLLPTLEHVESKLRDIKEALAYEFKEEDVEKIVQQKDRFRAHPTNYAMKKSELMKDRDVAALRGEEEKASELTRRIAELEERANLLDKVRTSTISSISYINDRNRKLNVEAAEKAIMEESKANKGKKIDDPFTRRSTKPVMNFKSFAAQEKRDEEIIAENMEAAKQSAMDTEPKTTTGTAVRDVRETDPYSLHDFEINIDLEVLPVTAEPAVPKPPPPKTKDTGPKRTLNLEEYKRKRGLI